MKTATLPNSPSTNGDTPKKRGLDPELQVMAKIDRMLSELQLEQIGRVLSWLNSRHFSETCPPAGAGVGGDPTY